jgi:hypothetical protein
MEGDLGHPDDRGIIPRVFEELFDIVNDTMVVKATYLEIFNEQIHDLLNPKIKNLSLNENNQDGGVEVLNLTQVEIKSKEALFKIFLEGRQNRIGRVSCMNIESTR